jgi:hypothetical protein
VQALEMRVRSQEEVTGNLKVASRSWWLTELS